MLVRIETNHENYKTFMKMWIRYVKDLRQKDLRVDPFNPAGFYEFYHNKRFRHFFMLDNEDIVGFISVVPRHGEVYIAETYIKEEYQDKGYGTKMVEELKKVYAGKSFVLEILCNNIRAFKFWNKCFAGWNSETAEDTDGFTVLKIFREV